MVKTKDCGSFMRGFESHLPPHKKDFGFCQGLFYLSDEDENPFEGSSEERVGFNVRFGRKQTKCRLGFQPNSTKS